MKKSSLKTISVSSSSKKAGKSSLASFLVGELGADFGLKASSGGTHHTNETIITDPEVVGKKGTDTGQLKDAGAKLVIWVNSSEERLGEDLVRALDMFPPEGMLLVEGNSAVAHLDPDFAVFLMSVPFEDFKPSADIALSRADLVLVDEDNAVGKRKREPFEERLRARSKGAEVIYFRNEQERISAWSAAARMIRERLRDQPPLPPRQPASSP
jgi:hypothetical protein